MYSIDTIRIHVWDNHFDMITDNIILILLYKCILIDLLKIYFSNLVNENIFVISILLSFQSVQNLMRTDQTP